MSKHNNNRMILLTSSESNGMDQWQTDV